MKRYYILMLIISFASGCSDMVDGLNDNPNSPTFASYSYVLTGTEVGNIIFQTGETARRAGIFCGYYTGIDRQHQGFSNYTLTTSDFDDLWEDAFVKTYRNAIETKKAAEAEGITGVTVGITQVIQAMTIGTVASLFGDTPFDEAGTLDAENPVFEDQVSVYTKVQTLLDEAIINLQAGVGRPTSGSEIYFDGDPVKWIEVAYTLKARFFMHVKDYGSAYTAAQSGISSNGNSLMAPHGTALDNSNLNYQFFAIQVRQSDLVTSPFMTSLVAPTPATNPIIANYRGNAKTNETARYNFLFRVTSFGTQPNTLANGFAAQSAKAPIVTYQENLLILAEAGFRTAGFTTGLSHLNDFRAYMATGGYMTNPTLPNLQYDAYVAADFDNGGIENTDGVSPDNALLREILEERYVTLFGQIEGFNDTRRTIAESAVRVPVAPNTGSALPERFIYPQSEIDRNINTPSPIPDLFAPTEINN